MALAATDKFVEFYTKPRASDVTTESNAASIFNRLLTAPWMSSGLTDNNAFTTVLVLRAYGFLQQEGIFGAHGPKADSRQIEWTREWAVDLGLRDAFGMAQKLKKHSDAASEYLWYSLSDDSRNLILDTLAGKTNQKPLKAALALELGRIIQSGWIYEPRLFTKASKNTKDKLRRFRSEPTSYGLTMINHELLAEQYPNELYPPTHRSLRDIAEMISAEPENFSINKYQPSPAVVYWFVDGIERAGIRLSPSRWDVLCKWAAKEFNHRRSLVVAEHDAMMDPVAMGMCACLCARLRSISSKTRLGGKKEHLRVLPSNIELERSVARFVIPADDR
jgi:hypothetical protein